jgi:hypothetical protein
MNDPGIDTTTFTIIIIIISIIMKIAFPNVSEFDKTSNKYFNNKTKFVIFIRKLILKEQRRRVAQSRVVTVKDWEIKTMFF